MSIIIDNYMKGLQRTIKYLSLLDQLQRFQKAHGSNVLSYTLVVIMTKSLHKNLRHHYNSELVKHDIHILRSLGLMFGYNNHLTPVGKELVNESGINKVGKAYESAGFLQHIHKIWRLLKSMSHIDDIIYLIGCFLLVYMAANAIIVPILIATHPSFIDLILTISIFVAEAIGLNMTDAQYKKYRYSPKYRATLNKTVDSFTEAKFIQFLINHDLIIKYLDRISHNAKGFDDMFVSLQKQG